MFFRDKVHLFSNLCEVLSAISTMKLWHADYYDIVMVKQITETGVLAHTYTHMHTTNGLCMGSRSQLKCNQIDSNCLDILLVFRFLFPGISLVWLVLWLISFGRVWITVTVPFAYKTFVPSDQGLSGSGFQRSLCGLVLLLSNCTGNQFYC